MLQYDLVAFGWQATIIFIFIGTVFFLTRKEEIKKREVEDSKLKRLDGMVVKNGGNILRLGERLSDCERDISRIGNIVDSLRGKDTRADVAHLKELFDELREDSLKTSSKLADHQKDITALKTNKALS